MIDEETGVEVRLEPNWLGKMEYVIYVGSEEPLHLDSREAFALSEILAQMVDTV